MNKVKVAAIQMRCAASLEENLKKAEAMVRKAAAEGANVTFCRNFSRGNIFASSAGMTFIIMRSL